jgi:MerR family transcriptional regulator, copper efflux regulator
MIVASSSSKVGATVRPYGPAPGARSSTRKGPAITASALTIGEVARRSGLSRKAVRLYEARGLLPPVQRLHNGYRRYSEHDVKLLRFIRRARGIGLGLDEIGTVIRLRRTGTPPSAEVIALLRQRLGAVEQAISELRSLQQALEGVLATAVVTAGHGDDVLLCDLLPQRA